MLITIHSIESIHMSYKLTYKINIMDRYNTIFHPDMAVTSLHSHPANKLMMFLFLKSHDKLLILQRKMTYCPSWIEPGLGIRIGVVWSDPYFLEGRIRILSVNLDPKCISYNNNCSDGKNNITDLRHFQIWEYIKPNNY